MSGLKKFIPEWKGVVISLFGTGITYLILSLGEELGDLFFWVYWVLVPVLAVPIFVSVLLTGNIHSGSELIFYGVLFFEYLVIVWGFKKVRLFWRGKRKDTVRSSI